MKKLLVCCAMLAMFLSMVGSAVSAPQGTVKTRVVVVQRKVVRKAHRRHRRHHTKRVAHHKTNIVVRKAQ
jgi:Ni/Co efflux regulator RcnB